MASGFSGHIEQAARRINSRRIQRRCPAARRTMSRPAASERENHQHDEAERDARRHHIEPEARQAATRIRGPEPHDRTQEHQNGA
jgi:hypothetical protein